MNVPLTGLEFGVTVRVMLPVSLAKLFGSRAISAVLGVVPTVTLPVRDRAVNNMEMVAVPASVPVVLKRAIWVRSTLVSSVLVPLSGLPLSCTVTKPVGKGNVTKVPVPVVNSSLPM